MASAPGGIACSSEVATFPAHEARFGLRGRTVFISGAAGHLGRAMAIGCAQAGAHVILNGRTAAKLEAFAGELAGQGLSASVAAFDIGDRARADAFLGGLARLDVLINNAIAALGSTQGRSLDEFRAMLETGLVAAHANVTAALPGLEAAVAATGQASVINVTSIWAHVSPAMHLYEGTQGLSPPQYSATKGGLIQLSRYLACELAPRRIRVNSLSPGLFPGDEIVAQKLPLVDRLAGNAPMRRHGMAHEIAGPALFLASDASSFMTGADLKVDGGWTAW